MGQILPPSSQEEPTMPTPQSGLLTSRAVTQRSPVVQATRSMVPCYSCPGKLIQVPPFKTQAPLLRVTREPPESRGSLAYYNTEGAVADMLREEEQPTAHSCGHLSCYVANGDTLATAAGKSPPDTNRSSSAHSAAMQAQPVFTQRIQIPEH